MKNGHYKKYQLINFFRLAKKKLKVFKLTKLKKYAGKKLLSAQEGNQVIKEALLKATPFVAARYGANELFVSLESVEIDLKKRTQIRDERMFSLCRNAGFFPNDKQLGYRYGKLQTMLSNEIDLFSVFGLKMEDYIIDAFGKEDAQVSLPRAIEPYYFDDPWSSALKGKKVLVIHPFEQSIKKQYAQREKLFSNLEVLPEFELYTIQAVQSSAFNKTQFDTWFDALQYMYEKAMAVDFDVAIIGCGAYGLPLACMLKKAGKTAIHMGGATQILFGIKGKRWDNHPIISKLYNEYWIRPLAEETPSQAQEIEGACYW